MGLIWFVNNNYVTKVMLAVIFCRSSTYPRLLQFDNLSATGRCIINRDTNLKQYYNMLVFYLFILVSFFTMLAYLFHHGCKLSFSNMNFHCVHLYFLYFVGHNIPFYIFLGKCFLKLWPGNFFILRNRPAVTHLAKIIRSSKLQLSIEK